MAGVSYCQMTNRDGNSFQSASEDTLGDHLHKSANNPVQLRTEAATMKPAEWQFTENPFLPINDVSENLITSQPVSEARIGVLRVTEMLRRINSEAGADLRGQSQEVEEERLEEAVSRRSSGADSGVGNMEDMGDILDPDRSRRGSLLHGGQGSRRQRLTSEGSEAASGAGESSSYSKVPMAGLPLVGAMMGLCLGGPVGVLAGAKLGGVAAVGGSILGYTGACVIKEQRELRTYIDDHYKREPDLYVLSPKEETILNRRMSIRTPPEGSRHLPGQRTGSLYKRGPGGYRRPSASGSGSCSSLPASPSVRRRGQSVRQAQTSQLKRRPTPRPSSRLGDTKPVPPHLVSRGQYRRLGDLTPDEQRSVLALIYNQGQLEERPFAVTSTSCGLGDDCDQQVIITRGVTITPDLHCELEAGASGRVATSSALERRRMRANRVKARTSSLPDVLEEDCISVKSLTAET